MTESDSLDCLFGGHMSRHDTVLFMATTPLVAVLAVCVYGLAKGRKDMIIKGCLIAGNAWLPKMAAEFARFVCCLPVRKLVDQHPGS